MIFSEPVTGRSLFGRQDILNTLQLRLENLKKGYRKNLALLGKELVGKSSCIHSFLKSVNSEDTLTVYVQVHPQPLSELAENFIGSLIFNLLQSKPLKIKEDLKYLTRHCRKYAPKTANAIKKVQRLIQKRENTEAFGLMLDLPAILSAEVKRPCVVIFEEFQNFSTVKSVSSPFSILSKKIITQRDVLFIITSSALNSARNILAGDLSLLFGNFEVIELAEFDFDTGKSFINFSLDPLECPDRYSRFLVSFTNGHPFYLDLICRQIKASKTGERSPKISKATIVQSLDELLYHPRGALNQFFTSKLRRLGTNSIASESISILHSVSSGYNRLAAIADFARLTPRVLKRPLTALEELDIISRQGSFYRFRDKVFRFWIKAVYSRKRNSFSLDDRIKKQGFISDVSRRVSSFTLESKKDLYQKTVELFRSFRGERVRIDGRTYTLPEFNDVSVKFIGDNGPYIVSQSKGKNWLCQIRERDVSEAQIDQILQDCQRGKYKFDKKVLIALNGMDENAKLAAKEARVWIWHLPTLNLILELYGMHEVVR